MGCHLVIDIDHSCAVIAHIAPLSVTGKLSWPRYTTELFVAEDTQGRRLWLFRDLNEGKWYLYGMF